MNPDPLRAPGTDEEIAVQRVTIGHITYCARRRLVARCYRGDVEATV